MILSRNVPYTIVSWFFEYLHLFKESKKMVILKLDFEKAFDKLGHNVITDILRHKGFSPKWLK